MSGVSPGHEFSPVFSGSSNLDSVLVHSQSELGVVSSLEVGNILVILASALVDVSVEGDSEGVNCGSELLVDLGEVPSPCLSDGGGGGDLMGGSVLLQPGVVLSLVALFVLSGHLSDLGVVVPQKGSSLPLEVSKEGSSVALVSGNDSPLVLDVPDSPCVGDSDSVSASNQPGVSLLVMDGLGDSLLVVGSGDPFVLGDVLVSGDPFVSVLVVSFGDPFVSVGDLLSPDPFVSVSNSVVLVETVPLGGLKPSAFSVEDAVPSVVLSLVSADLLSSELPSVLLHVDVHSLSDPAHVSPLEESVLGHPGGIHDPLTSSKDVVMLGVPSSGLDPLES